MNKWDERFLGLAQHISQWSKDPSTKVGAVITDSDNRIISLGYNGFPRRIDDHDYRYNQRDLKYKMIIHAEKNAVLFAKASLVGCTVYTYPFMPCSQCASMLIQVGIKRVVSLVPPSEKAARWADDFSISDMMFKEAGVELMLYDKV